METLELSMKHHDWYFEFSDDHRVWTRGRNSWEQIKARLCALPYDEANALWEKYAPKEGFQHPIPFHPQSAKQMLMEINY